MTRVSPTILLVLFASVSLFLALVAGFIGGTLGLGALVAASFFLSIQFPTIFALGINGLGALRHAGASLIVMAIIGGAALTAAMGAVSDIAGITRAMLVPAASFGVVIVFALSALRTPTIPQDTTP
jgi:FHS family L-fucose permease-like MFS transporter